VIREILIAAAGTLAAGALVLAVMLVASVVRASPEFPPFPPGAARHEEES